VPNIQVHLLGGNSPPPPLVNDIGHCYWLISLLVYIFICCWLIWCVESEKNCPILTGPFSLKKHFHGQKIFRNFIIKSWKFSTSNFIATQHLCRPITFYKIFSFWKNYPEWKWAITDLCQNISEFLSAVINCPRYFSTAAQSILPTTTNYAIYTQAIFLWQHY
jgi:hypothetical protein